MNRGKKAYQKFFNALFQLAAVFVFFIALFSLIKWLIEKTPAAQLAVEQAIGTNPPPSAAVPSPSAPTVSKASFTELFSGVGWKDESKSTAYQDLKTTVISLPPAYDLKEVSALSAGLKNETIIAAKGNGREVVLVAKSGKIMSLRGAAGDEAISIIQSSLPTEALAKAVMINNQLKSAVLDYDESSGAWVIAAATVDGGIVAGPIGHTSPISPMGLISSLACANGECLVLADSTIYSFPENSPSLLSKINLPAGITSKQSVSLGKAGSVLLAGIVEKNGSAYSGEIFKYSAGSFQSLMVNNQPLFSSIYPGTIRFGYDSADDKILAVYAAYIGQAYILEISNSEFKIAENYSNFFPQRVMEGMSQGETRFDPEIFYENGAWWLGSAAQSPVQKIVRIEGGVANDITDSIGNQSSAVNSQSSIMNNQSPFSAIINNQSLFTVPGFGNRQVYIIAMSEGAAKVFRLTDLGFDAGSKVVWESSNLNQWSNDLVSGDVFRIDADENGGALNYFLSADGGQSWLPAKLGETVYFNKDIVTGKTGNDFRYKIEISPGSNRFQSPWVDTIGVEYSVSP
ncbi:MAG TPA: hypothetical protein VMV71_03990 [Candidatus Paceibacterota bacterium]|nr:hypothetical protein [Candidatus Paceibacterota bacterium]